MKKTNPKLLDKLLPPKPTKLWNKRRISNSELTNSELSIRRSKIEDYCLKRINDFNSIYDRYYFSNNVLDYVKLVDYYKYPHSNQVTKELDGINYERLEREHTNHIIASLEQAKQVIGSINKSYREKIIDSNELYGFLLALFELDEWTESKGVNKYDFAQNLFLISLKIMIDNSPAPIQNHLINSIKQFYDISQLPTMLGYKSDKALIVPKFTRIRGSDDYMMQIDLKGITKSKK